MLPSSSSLDRRNGEVRRRLAAQVTFAHRRIGRQP
jgi:hypothetical protein